MADGELSKIDQAVKAAGDALVADVVATVRAHPQYVDLVNGLTEKAVAALLAAI
ncbi:MAG TPA: hypothetical protein VN714_24360 [Trebonia sp.]|nr:hypothetical protein [Trebonia sp.]